MKSIKQLRIVNIILNVIVLLSMAAIIVFGAIANKVGVISAIVFSTVIFAIKYYNISKKYEILFKDINSKVEQQLGKRNFSLSLAEQKKFIVVEVKIEDGLSVDTYSECYEMLNQYFDNIEDVIKKPPIIHVLADKYL